MSALGRSPRVSRAAKLLLVLFAHAACAGAAAGGGGTAGDVTAGSPLGIVHSWLRDWLASLVLEAPPEDFAFDGFSGEISRLTCRGLSVGAIHAAPEPGAGVLFSASRLAVSCTARWSYEAKLPPHLPRGSGTLEASLGNASSAALAVRLPPGAGGLPGAASASSCDVQLEVQSMEFGGGVTAEVLELLRPAIRRAVKRQVGKVACGELEALVDTNLTGAVRGMAEELRPYLEPSSPRVSPAMPTGAVDLGAAAPMRLLSFLARHAGHSHGTFGAKWLVDVVAPGGRLLHAGGPMPNSTIALPGAGNVSLALESFSVDGLDSVEDLEVRPTSRSTVEVGLAMGQVNGTAHVRIEASPSGGPVSGGELVERAELQLALHDLHLRATLAVGVDGASLGALQLDQLAAVGCWLRAVPVAALTELSLEARVKAAGLAALSGDDLERELDAAAGVAVEQMLAEYGSTLTTLLNGAVTGPVRDAAADAMAAALEAMRMNDTGCPPTDPNAHVDYGAVPAAAGWCAVVLLTGAVAALLGAAARGLLARRTAAQEEDGGVRRPLLGVLSAASGEVDAPGLLGAPPDSGAKPRADRLSASPRVPRAVAYALPAVVVGNVLLFVSSNTSVGARVTVEAALRGAGGGPATVVSMPPVFDFSLANSVRDMWNAGTYPLAILVAVFSGGWPYAKLGLMLVAWLAPLQSKARERFLMALDALGKWSLIDSFIMVLFMAAFRFHLDSGGAEGGGGEVESVDMRVVPLPGFMVFVAATVLSMVCSHVMLALHRRADGGHARVVAAGEPRALCAHAHPAVAVGTAAALVGTGAVVGWGAAARSFSFEFRGLAGLALGDSADRTFSLVGLVRAVGAGAGSGPTVGTIQALLVLFTLVTLYAHLSVLLVLWLAPLRPTRQGSLFKAAEVFNAWASLDVFVVAVVSALLQIKQFAAFMVGSKCDLINGLLEEYLDKELGGDDTCFDVTASLDRGAAALGCAAAAWFVTAMVVMRSCERSLAAQGAEGAGAGSAA